METGQPSAGRQVLLLRAYLAYNAQDLDRLLALVSEDVDWPDGVGGRILGRQALAAYWTEQWERVRAHDHPVAFHQRDDGRVAVHVRQVVWSLDGSERSRGEFVHVHRVGDAHIDGMDIEGSADPGWAQEGRTALFEALGVSDGGGA